MYKFLGQLEIRVLRLLLMIYLAALSLLFAPTYAIRFEVYGLPTNLLMLWLFLVDVILIVKLFSNKLKVEFTALQKKLLFFSGVFFLSGVISVFVGGFSLPKLALFIVLFFQPLLWFFYFSIHKPNEREKQNLVITAFISAGILGLVAIFQYFTLYSLPESYWGNSVEPKRALSLFSHPNFYALFIAPLLAFLLPHALTNKSELNLFNFKINSKTKVLFWVIGLVGLICSLSRSGWLGLAAAIGLYTLIAADAKIRKFILGAALILSLVIIFTPNLRYRFLLPFYGEKSAVSRLSLWQTGVKGIKESPIFGLGLKGFAIKWDSLNTDPNLNEKHNLPHNLFLNLWVETGLMGIISFLGVLITGLYIGFKEKNDPYKLGVLLFMTAFLIQGQIDNPYFKNDLALIFWLVLAFLF